MSWPKGKKRVDVKHDEATQKAEKEFATPQPKALSGGCVECKHIDERHYGGEKNWCNHPGCPCQGYVA